MATNIYEQYPKSAAEKTISGASIPRQYQVITTEDLTEEEVWALSGIPKLKDTLSGSSAYVTSVSAIKTKDNNNEYIWDVTVIYSYDTTGSTGLPGYSNDRLISYRLGYRSYSVIPQQFFRGTTVDGSIQNSAGMPFDNPPSIEKYNTVVQWVQREYGWFNPSGVTRYMNTINDSATTVVGMPVPEGCGLLRQISPELKRDDDGTIHYETTYEVEIDYTGFIMKIRDNGFKQLVNGKLVDILKGDVNPDLLTGTADERAEAKEKINDPADLNNGVAVVQTPTSTATYLEFQPFQSTGWGSLNLIRSLS